VKRILACVAVCGFLVLVNGLSFASEYPVNKSTAEELKALATDQTTYTAGLQTEISKNVGTLQSAEVGLAFTKTMELTLINAALSSLYQMFQLEYAHAANEEKNSQALEITKNYVTNTMTFVEGAIKRASEFSLQNKEVQAKFSGVPDYLAKDMLLLDKISQELQ